jgi:hypothetical protein
MPSPHDKIIASAAKATLGSQGFQRKGQSRLWFADNGWWLSVVEFQPSGWSKGSYLNVAAHWLWSESGHISFDFGGRIAEHQPYRSDQQFALAAARLAASAAVEAKRLLLNFPSVDAAADLLLKDVRNGNDYKNGHPGWAAYHAGVASALVGRSSDATDMFALVEVSPAPAGSVLDTAANKMSRLLAELSEFKCEVASMIERQRAALKLPTISVFS